jgi:hypothetical protein
MEKSMKILCIDGSHEGIILKVPCGSEFIEASAFCQKFRQTSSEDGEWVDGYEFSQYSIFTDLWSGVNAKTSPCRWGASRQIDGICYPPSCDNDDLLYRLVDHSMREIPIHVSSDKWKHDDSYLRVLKSPDKYNPPTIDIERATKEDSDNLIQQRKWYAEYIYS